MKRCRYAALLAVFMFFVAGFGAFGTETMTYSGTDVQSGGDGAAVAYSSEDTRVERIADVERKEVAAVATTAAIRQAAVKSGGSTVKASGVCGGYYGYVSIGGKNICLKSTDSTGGSLSYNFGYTFNSSTYNSYNQYIFAHNSANLFGGLAGLAVGTKFSVTIGGSTVNYRISKKQVYCDYSNPSHPCSNYSEPVLNMYDAVNPGRQGANLALMTCAGSSIGNGDATHRLIVYANRV